MTPSTQPKRFDFESNHTDNMLGGVAMARSKFAIVGELWQFMKIRKKWWLGPIVLMLLALGLLLVFTQGSALAPFIYTLF